MSDTDVINGKLTFIIKWGLMPVKILVVIVGLIILPLGVTVEWGTSAYDKSWDQLAGRYLYKLFSIF